MSGAPGPRARVRRLEAAISAAAVHAEAERLAVELGIAPAVLLADARIIAARCQAAGAVTPRQMADLIFAEAGLDAAEPRTDGGASCG